MLELLQAEHENGTWVGKELIKIASKVRNLGGNEDDYRRWVLASNLWLSYTGSTGDKIKDQEKHLDGAWERAQRDEDFDLEESLTALGERIRAYADWPKRGTAGRDRAVALALVEFCVEHNCFTRTLSSYELAKWTAGISQKSVSRALSALTDLGLIRELDRTDRRTSPRSAKRYRLNLQWAAHTRPTNPDKGGTNTDLRSTGIASLSHELHPPHDVWSRKGLGPSAQRVYEVLSDEHVTARSISEKTGMNVRSVTRYLKILADHALAGTVPPPPGGAPRYFVVETPLDAVADALGIYGHVEIRRWEIEQRQRANREAFPGAYRRLADEDGAPLPQPEAVPTRDEVLDAGPDWSRRSAPERVSVPRHVVPTTEDPFATEPPWRARQAARRETSETAASRAVSLQPPDPFAA
ncbi:hypothetical protein [Mycolicibacterium psychrotolerans]|uniref:hypothetical protein n=1 Tax=Mycolicibacterium psychrotolerans TaxID=216929 RepID=UPI0013D3CED5|nr:hypothetical protein [Mycolicibacterium psychrotolerans]